MKKDEAAALGIFALLAIGVAVFAFGDDATAAEPDPFVPPDPDDPGIPGEEKPGIDPGTFKDPFKPKTTNGPVPSIDPPIPPDEPPLPTKIPINDLISAGAKCQLDGEPYNALDWPSPSAVAFALTLLGFPVSSTLQTPGDSDSIRDFQIQARLLFLQGMQAAPDSFIDGVPGPCTLRALTAAARRFNAGTW